MTPTEKDAMALAVLDRAAQAAYERCECPDSISCTECNLAAPYRRARAHLAARLAEQAEQIESLTTQRDLLQAAMDSRTARMERAEAELAAVKVNADRYIFTRDDPSAGAQIMVDGSLRELFGDELDAAVDAARGGE